MGASYGVAVVLPLILVLAGVGRLSTPLVSWVGLIVMLLGLAFRAWSMRVLGASYTRTLRVSAQEVVDRGPYRYVRHPGYLGSILIWIGFAIALADWVGIVVIVPLMVGVYVYRIQAEETMLVAAFGDRYEGYRERSWRLVPFLY